MYSNTIITIYLADDQYNLLEIYNTISCTSAACCDLHLSFIRSTLIYHNHFRPAGYAAWRTNSGNAWDATEIWLLTYIVGQIMCWEINDSFHTWQSWRNIPRGIEWSIFWAQVFKWNNLSLSSTWSCLIQRLSWVLSRLEPLPSHSIKWVLWLVRLTQDFCLQK